MVSIECWTGGSSDERDPRSSEVATRRLDVATAGRTTERRGDVVILETDLTDQDMDGKGVVPVLALC
jgi:hypothetical protein